MNDEIKEILNYFKDDIEFLEKELINTNFLGRYITIRDKECGYLKKLLDYITNLQHTKEYLGEVLYEKDKELEKLNNKIKHYEETQTFGDYVKEVNLLVDYKSRCEKAVEYLKNNCYIGDCINTYEAIDITNVMDILNGKGSDE